MYGPNTVFQNTCSKSDGIGRGNRQFHNYSCKFPYSPLSK